MVFVRANTSDVNCLVQVFADEQYKLPIDANPSFAIEPRLIVDAGANIGMATLYFAHIFPGADIFAIEPEHTNFELLKKNCSGLSRITVRQAALWNERARLQLCDPSVDKWLFSVQPALMSSTPAISSITVSDILRETGRRCIDILKLDIEGAERELFSNSSDDWLPFVKLIVIELHDRFKVGCSETFYKRICQRPFIQEVRGENIFVLFETKGSNAR
jgi:FkbM family methyltransferase